MVSIDFPKLAAGAEQNYGSKLRVDAATHNQFVAIQVHHRLHSDTGELVGARFLSQRTLNSAIGGADRRFILQVQLDTANIRLMRDGFGKNLQDNWKTNLRGQPDCLIFASRDPRLNRWDAVQR